MKFRILILILFCSAMAFGQASFYTTALNTSGFVNGVKVLQSLGGATVQFCNAPANIVPCTNFATIYTDSTASTTVTQPITADANGNWSVWAVPGNYQYTFTYQGQNFGPFNAVVPISTLSNQGINGICVPAAFTDAAIQTAVNSCPDGSEVYLPAGIYNMCSSLPVLITKRLTFHGAGTATNLQVCAGASGTTDIISLKSPNSSTVFGAHLYDFQISAASGTPGRDGIVFDGVNNGAFGYVEIDHITIAQLGANAIGAINSAGVFTGNPFTTRVHDSLFFGGLSMANMGDNVTFDHDTFAGTGALIIQGVTGPSNGGPHGFSFDHNNITVNGMLQIINAWKGHIGPANNFEQTINGGPNGCAIDIQGNTSTPGPPQGITISQNYIAGFTCAVRVDKAVGTVIRDNYVLANSFPFITITANADRTYFGYNRMAPDVAITSFLSDAGTNTSGDFFDSSTGQLNHYGFIATQNSAGTRGVAINQNLFAVNPTNGAFCSTSGDPGGTACDTFLYRKAADSWAMGNAYGDNSALLTLGGLKAPNLVISATAPTISSGFGTSPSILASNGTASFRVNVGTGGTATSGVIGLPTAFTGWNCYASDVTTPAAYTRLSASTSNSVTLTNYSSAGAATAWVASDQLAVSCFAY